VSEWKQYSLTQTVPMVRDGWAGLWDALVSVVTRQPRATFLQPVTISFWAKHNADVSFTQMQAEYKDQS